MTTHVHENRPEAPAGALVEHRCADFSLSEVFAAFAAREASPIRGPRLAEPDAFAAFCGAFGGGLALSFGGVR